MIERQNTPSRSLAEQDLSGRHQDLSLAEQQSLLAVSPSLSQEQHAPVLESPRQMEPMLTSQIAIHIQKDDFTPPTEPSHDVFGQPVLAQQAVEVDEDCQKDAESQEECKLQ